MSMSTLQKNMDSSFYQEARVWRSPEGLQADAIRYYGDYARKEGVYPEKDQLAEIEDHYLRELHVRPWEEYRRAKVKAFCADYAAVELVFNENRVPLRGPYSESVEKAFTIAPLQVIFPIFYDTQIMAGILAMPILDVLVMDTVQVNSGTADHAVMNETQTDRQFGTAGEWTTFSEINISATNAPIKLIKFGGILNASDEAIRRARIPVFARGVERVGRQLGIDLTDKAIDVLLNGDGNTGAPVTVAALNPGSPSYLDYLKLFYSFPIGYEPSDVIESKFGLITMNSIPEFKDPLAGFKFQNQGVLPEPMGLMSHRWDSTGSTTWSNGGLLNLVLVIQRNRALVQYQEGGLSTESERILNGEFTRVKSSLYVNYGRWDPASVVAGTGFA